MLGGSWLRAISGDHLRRRLQYSTRRLDRERPKPLYGFVTRALRNCMCNLDNIFSNLLSSEVLQMDLNIPDADTNELFDCIPANPKIFWSYLRNYRRQDTSQATMGYVGNPASDPLEVYEAFATFFSSVFSHTTEQVRNYQFSSPFTLNGLLFTEDEVFKAMGGLDGSK
ncbi:hypothetical protein J6590_000051 [Homalodisca vitripennis]|nr:hypothetical protein J6590_000051 [Homalodisca vitripennis]